MYIISDAPRDGRADDEEKVRITREYVESHIDWDCEVHKNYAEHNMGCKMRVSSGISWVLEHETRTIILEDDIVPIPDFFRFCQEMLDEYEDNERVMMVSGANLIHNHSIEKQYTFSCFAGIWGWATWRRAWKDYDVDIKDWPETDKSGEFRKVQNGLAYMFLRKHMYSVYNHEKDTWDYQWDYCRFKKHGLGIVPKNNMIVNIGFGEDATHTDDNFAQEEFPTKPVDFPLVFDVPVKRDCDFDKKYIVKNFGVKRALKVLKKRMTKG